MKIRIEILYHTKHAGIFGLPSQRRWASRSQHLQLDAPRCGRWSQLFLDATQCLKSSCSTVSASRNSFLITDGRTKGIIVCHSELRKFPNPRATIWPSYRFWRRVDDQRI